MPSKLSILEDSSAYYGPRTFANAKKADLTVAFAVDFSTAGERLTHKAAGKLYVGIPLTTEPIEAARTLWKNLKCVDGHTLNVAGNGIYTLASHGWTQKQINAYVYKVFAKVAQHWDLSLVRSGGQTGVDIAGLVAAYALGIEALALLPKGFIQRGTDKRDVSTSENLIRTQIVEGAANLRGLK